MFVSEMGCSEANTHQKLSLPRSAPYLTGNPEVMQARNRPRKSEKGCLLSSLDARTHLPCEVTAYDWSCSQCTMVLAFFEKWLDGCLRSRVVELWTICIMLRNGIAQFVGSWVSESGYQLRIKKVDKDRALVDFLDRRAAPVQRPYMGGAFSLKMVAHYGSSGIFEVDLWQEGKGFSLDLTHEYDYELDPERREALVPALSRNEQDHFLDAWYALFGPLDHFVRTKAENKRLDAK